MSEPIKAAIAELQNQIRNWEEEIIQTKRVINALCKSASMPAIYQDADLQQKASVGAMRRDQFYGKTLTSAMREYLQMRQVGNLGPATVNEIYDSLNAGGFDHGSANEDNAKRVIRITLTKNSAIFHRLPDGSHYGLIEWYPDVKVRKSKKDATGTEGATEAAESVADRSGGEEAEEDLAA